MKTVTIYTDGACSGNPGPGGWCAILEYQGREKMISGGEESTTNNRMELMAVISALLALREPCVVELYSDSKYVIDALEKGWAWGWKRRGWVKADKKPALNPDLWDTLLGLTRQHEMHYHWVKGHEANEKNNRCDEQAVLESRKFKDDPPQAPLEGEPGENEPPQEFSCGVMVYRGDFLIFANARGYLGGVGFCLRMTTALWTASWMGYSYTRSMLPPS